MKSFIRSHRHSNSVENDHNISKHNFASFTNSSFTNFQDSLDFFNSPKKMTSQEFNTPPPSIHNLHHSSPSKHSPTFESFHKLANKTHKLFKKNSNSNLRSSIDLTTNTNTNGTVVTNSSRKINNESFDHKSKSRISFSSFSGFNRNNSDVDDLPAIKGMTVHLGGSSNKRFPADNNNGPSMTVSNNDDNMKSNSSKSEDHIMYLNMFNYGNNNPLIGDNKKFGDLSPPVEIPGKSSVVPNETGKNYSNQDQRNVRSTQHYTDNELDEPMNELNMPKVRSTHVSKTQKYKNRKAQIHSNEDLLSLQAVVGNNRELDSKTSQKSDMLLASNSLVIPSIIIQKPVTSDITPVLDGNIGNDTGSKCDETSESGSESESDVSEFSFEYSRLNGRTSSVKYYSKPEDEETKINNEKVYINDIYEDENFDEDMNYDDGDDMDNIDYSLYNLNGDNGDNIELNKSTSDDNREVINKKLPNLKKPITKYSDLFDETSSNNDENDTEDVTFKDIKHINNKSIIQPVIKTTHKLKNYDDLFDLSDSDDIEQENGYNSDTVTKGNIEHTNEQESNDHPNLFNAISNNNSTNRNDSSPRGYESTKRKNLLNKNNNVEQYYVNSKKIGVNSVQVKSAATSNHQIRSFDDLFHISDEEEEGDTKIEKESKNKTVIEPLQSDVCHTIKIQESSINPSTINTNTLSLPEDNKIPKFFKPKDDKDKNITKYSDLFDLSDDEDTTDSVNEAAFYVNQESSLNSSSNSISDGHDVRTSLSNVANIWNGNKTSKSPLSITTNINSQLLSVKPIKKPFIRSYRNFPILSDDYNDETDTENESLTPLTSHLDILSPLNSRLFTPIKNIPSSPTANKDNNTSIQTPTNILPSQPLPPTTRSNILKYYDLNSNLDSEVPGLTSTLYFIDEAEEDEYNNMEKHNLENDTYAYDLDEINKVPEDFEFSQEDVARSRSRHLRAAFGSPLSFRRTHSYHSKPVGVPRGVAPLSNRLEINNKTVTFFNGNWSNNVTNNLSSLNYGSVESRTPPSRSPLTSPSKMNENSSKIFSKLSPINATNSQYSLSPIQESSSVISSPERT